jgi:anti-sigma B factor antagonist
MESITISYENCEAVKLSGRIDSYTAPQFASVMSSITNQGKYNIILDMSDVNYVSSAGLRVLIDIQKTCKREHRGETVLVKLPPRVYETMELAGFLPLFKLFDDLLSATDYFQK